MLLNWKVKNEWSIIWLGRVVSVSIQTYFATEDLITRRLSVWHSWPLFSQWTPQYIFRQFCCWFYLLFTRHDWIHANCNTETWIYKEGDCWPNYHYGCTRFVWALLDSTARGKLYRLNIDWLPEWFYFLRTQEMREIKGDKNSSLEWHVVLLGVFNFVLLQSLH